MKDLKNRLSNAFRKLRKITLGKIYNASDPGRKDINLKTTSRNPFN